MATSDDSKIRDVPLAERLRARIRREGPISFYDWMKAALYDEREGYYCRSDRVRWGREGDYRTAPETSPLFGATFARYCAALFSELGSPPAWTIVEAGAGNGDFAHGFLDVLQSRYADVFAATSYVIDEVSANTRERTNARLARFADRVAFLRLSEINEPFPNAVFFSNEVLDAFPVHRVKMREGKLCELYVDLDADDVFNWVEGELNEAVAEYCARTLVPLAEGQIAEVNLEAGEFIARAGALLNRGFVITVDYGSEREELIAAPHRVDGTLRAFQGHQLAGSVLASPGVQDLTTTIDWTQIREAGEGAGLDTVRYEPLDKFLLQEGLLEELEASAAKLSDDAEILRLRTGAREMIMPHGLTASFQILIQKKRP